MPQSVAPPKRPLSLCPSARPLGLTWQHSDRPRSSGSNRPARGLLGGRTEPLLWRRGRAQPAAAKTHTLAHHNTPGSQTLFRRRSERRLSRTVEPGLSFSCALRGRVFIARGGREAGGKRRRGSPRPLLPRPAPSSLDRRRAHGGARETKATPHTLLCKIFKIVRPIDRCGVRRPRVGSCNRAQSVPALKKPQAAPSGPSHQYGSTQSCGHQVQRTRC